MARILLYRTRKGAAAQKTETAKATGSACNELFTLLYSSGRF